MTANVLSKSPSGSVKELFLLSTPIFFSLLSSNLMLFCDRYFLSRYSLEAFNAVGVANYLVMLFQLTCIRFSSINQVFIGRSLGNGKIQNIGPYTWQMIWGSLLTFLLIFPAALAGKLYFANTEVKALGETYFSIMMLGNFLFPLGATLAGFQLGLGKTKILSFVALVSNFLNVILDYYLINGITGILDPLGVKGAAIATLISQSVYCAILFFLFINNPLKKEYKTKDFYFRPSLFKECSKIGITSSLSRLVGLFFWTLSMNIVASRGGDYITLISFGSSICILTSIINESVSKGLTTFFSYFLGQNNWKYVWKSLRSGIVFLIWAFGLLALPFIIYKQHLIEMTVGTNITNPSTMNFLRLACYWLWITFLLEGITFSIISLLISMKETAFLFKAGIFITFLTSYLPYLSGYKIGNLAPDKIWMLTWICFTLTPTVHLFKILKSYRQCKKFLPMGRKNLFEII